MDQNCFKLKIPLATKCFYAKSFYGHKIYFGTKVLSLFFSSLPLKSFILASFENGFNFRTKIKSYLKLQAKNKQQLFFFCKIRASLKQKIAVRIGTLFSPILKVQENEVLLFLRFWPIGRDMAIFSF